MLMLVPIPTIPNPIPLPAKAQSSSTQFYPALWKFFTILKSITFVIILFRRAGFIQFQHVPYSDNTRIQTRLFTYMLKQINY